MTAKSKRKLPGEKKTAKNTAKKVVKATVKERPQKKEIAKKLAKGGVYKTIRLFTNNYVYTRLAGHTKIDKANYGKIPIGTFVRYTRDNPNIIKNPDKVRFVDGAYIKTRWIKNGRPGFQMELNHINNNKYITWGVYYSDIQGLYRLVTVEDEKIKELESNNKKLQLQVAKLELAIADMKESILKVVNSVAGIGKKTNLIESDIESIAGSHKSRSSRGSHKKR